MSMAADRIVPLCELLLGAAYADKELKDQEKDEVRSLLEGLAGELPTDVELKIVAFDPASFDLKASAAPFKGDSEDDRKKLLYLVSAVNEADEEIDLAEDQYLRDLAAALDLPKAALEGLTVEIETEELKETFKQVRKGPPPPPPPKMKSVDVDMD
ncbi:MAG TPA: TerB family tellurite resistance protein [Kofleriaceae bacterium]